LAKENRKISEIPTEELVKDFEMLAKELDEVLEDIKWRKPDLEDEEKKLDELKRKQEEGEDVDTYSQQIVVRVQRDILKDKIKQAETLEEAMNRIKRELERREGERKRKKSGKHEKARVSQEAQ